MGFCEYTVKDGVFILTLDGGDGGHNWLTLQSVAELLAKLKEIRSKARPLSKGLITNSAGGGSFCDGVDYDKTPPLVVDELVYRMAEVVRELYDMPFPTVAAVTGHVRTSLALALVLAHDEIAAKEGAIFEVKEVQDGHGYLPPYFASLLRERVGYPRMRLEMVLQSKCMTVSDMKYWDVFDTSCIEDKDVDGVNTTSSIITGSFCVGDNKAYVTTRKSFYPEAWKAVSEFLGHKQ